MTSIPEWLADIKNVISEKGSIKEQFAIEFEKATEDKENLDDILKPFLVYLLEGTLKTFDHDTFKDAKDSIDHIIRLLKKENVTEEELKSAIHAAADVAWATNVAAAAWAATWAATWAAAVLSGWADAAARAAAVLSDRADATADAAAAVLSDRADATADAAAAVLSGWADAAARAAAVLSDRADATAYAAAWVTRADFYDDLADKLLELIRGAKY